MIKYYLLMRECIFALMCDKECEKILYQLRKNLFKETGDETIFSLPPFIMLGKTEKTSFDRAHFNFNLKFENNFTLTNIGYLLKANDDNKLKELQKSLGIEEGPTGIYFSKKNSFKMNNPIVTKHQRLVLLKPYLEGFTLLQ